MFDYLSPDELAERRALASKQKQLRFADWETELIGRIGADLDLGEPATLPPSVLYTPLQHLFISDAGPQLRHVSRYAPIPAPPADPDVAAILPEDYVAVRFYFSLAFPPTDANRALVARAVRSLAEQTDIVVLNTGFTVDDHRDAEADAGRVVLLQDHMTLTNNLSIQSQAIAGARAFVGTYGGLAYLPCFMGVPSIGLYSGKGQFNPWHVDVAQRIFSEEPYGDLVIVNADHMDLVGALAEPRKDGCSAEPQAARALRDALPGLPALLRQHDPRARGARAPGLGRVREPAQAGGGTEGARAPAGGHRGAAGLPKRGDALEVPARAVRRTTDYVRYLHPYFRDAQHLRRRLEYKLPLPARMLTRLPTLPAPLARLLIRAMLVVERSIPSSSVVEKFIRGLAPDVVVVTPLVALASRETDLVKSARALGIPSVLGVASWDHLTSKGLIRVMPDKVVLWNELSAKRRSSSMTSRPRTSWSPARSRGTAGSRAAPHLIARPSAAGSGSRASVRSCSSSAPRRRSHTRMPSSSS